MFAQKCGETYAQMSKLSKGEILYTSPLPDSSCLKIGDVTNDVTAWESTAWQEYYGIAVIARQAHGMIRLLVIDCKSV